MIDVQHLSKRYGHVRAVDDLSFSAKAGHVTGFVGPNGAGKSTTMRMILGLDRPDGGVILIGGRPYRDLERPLSAIGALLDAGAVDDGRRAVDHLRWLADSNRIDRKRVCSVLDDVGLTEVADRRVGTFSLGMRQRLGLAAALLGDPAIVMLDEPANGLDPDGILWLRQFTRRLADEGRTVFVSSHLMNEVAQTADHLVVIGKGRLIADASTESILAEHGFRNVYVRADRQADLARELVRRGGLVQPDVHDAIAVRGLPSNAIGAIALAEGIALTELTPREPSLEEAFLELTHDASLHPAATGTPERN